MAIRSNAAVLRQIQTLFNVGVIGDLTDAQLLERFTTLDREEAERAFAAIVQRHGPMVLRVCGNLLRNPQDAEDACQATFFILLRKARYVWVRDSLAPWLHRVARRVASRARASALRRREHERRAAELRLKVVHADDHAEGLLGLLHAEIDRLPARYRAAVIVCDIEGLSHERAARQLGWPVGTVKSRLARARQLLRSRLTARGLAAPTILALTEAAACSADAAFSLPIVHSTVRSVLLAANAPTIGVVSVSVANLAEEVLQTMFLTKWKLTWAGLLIAGALTAGTAAVLGRQSDRSNLNLVADRPDARRADIATPAVEPEATDAPDFIKQSRGMIITRLEQELALSKARLDRTLKRVSAPDDPAVLQARRTVAEIEFQLARIDGVLVNAVDRFPTMFDFSGEHVDLSAGPGAPKSGTMLRLNVNDVYQSSIRKSGNWQKNNPSELAPSQNTNPFGGANKDGAQGQGNPPSSNAKSGDGQGNNFKRQASSQNAKSPSGMHPSGTNGQGENPSPSSKGGQSQSDDPRQMRENSSQAGQKANANRQTQAEDRDQKPIQSQRQNTELDQYPNFNQDSQQQSNQSQPRNANQQPQQNSDQSQRPSYNQNPQQNTNHPEQQSGKPQQQNASKPQQQNTGQPQQQNASQPQQQDATQLEQHNAIATGGGGYDSNNRKAIGVAAVDLMVQGGTPAVDVGGQATFLIRLGNKGTRDATHLMVTADLARNLEFLRGGETNQKVSVVLDSRTNALTFQRIDKIGPGEVIILRVVARVTGPDPKLATCGVSVTHEDLPAGEKLEDMAAIKVTKQAAP